MPLKSEEENNLKLKNPSSYGMLLQGRRNARTEHIDKFEDGMVEFPVAWGLFIRRRASVLALEDFLREEEAHLNTRYHVSRTEIVLTSLRF